MKTQTKKIFFLLPIILSALVGCKSKMTKNKNLEPAETKQNINKNPEVQNNPDAPPHYNLEDLPIKSK